MTPAVIPRHFAPAARIGIGIGTKTAVTYRCIASNGRGHIFQDIDNERRIEHFTHEEIAELEQSPGWRYLPFGDDTQRRMAQLASDLARHCDTPKREVPKVVWKDAWCRLFLRVEAAGKATRSEDGLTAFIQDYQSEIRLPRPPNLTKRRRLAGVVKARGPVPSWKSLQRWLAKFEATDCDPRSHRDGYSRCGGPGTVLPEEVETLLVEWTWKYAVRSRPFKKHLHGGLTGEINKLNKVRAAEKLPPLPIPSFKLYRKRIDALPPFDVHAGRYGIDAARKKFLIVSGGVDVERPGQRVEIDGWVVQLQSLLIRTEIWEHLNRKMRRTVERVRPVLIVAIDVASKCILGMRLSLTESTQAALDTLKMIIMDKGRFADAVGALSTWHMCCGIETLAFDQGSAFVGEEFQNAVLSLNTAPFAPPAGRAYLRGHVERVLSTLHTGLISRFDGRTFEHVVANADYTNEDNATLTIEQLCWALVRYIVDAYHNSPHAGLGGETPAHAWERLCKLYGTVALPDRDTRRNVFGVRPKPRVIGPRGIRFLNNDYQSLALQEWHRNNKHSAVQIVADVDDLGRISVELGDGMLTVPNIVDGFDDISTAAWAEICADLRRRFPTGDVPENAARDALADIDRLAAIARRTAGIASPSLTAEQLDHAENDLQIAWTGLSDADDLPSSDDIFDNVHRPPGASSSPAPRDPPDDNWTFEEE